MDIHFELNGTTFVWNAKKAAANPIKHDGITFEQAAMVFFDPFFRLVDAGRNDEARDAVIGYDTQARLLYVVHVEIEDESIRIISARKATNEERKHHDP
ncbi:MAG: BrnT family toxin [Pseudomonadota bacterium]|nr:BrnT family toxin [Pseudomonadota bacterium]MDP2352953.1 BrnT family toxin [Pseudomonadota bacterium]